MKHTELPLRLYISKDARHHELYSASNRKIAELMNYDSSPHKDRNLDEEMARLIVRAVNNFFPMLEALKKIAKHVDGEKAADIAKAAITASEKE